MKSLFRLAATFGLIWTPAFAGPAGAAGAPRIPFGFVENRGETDAAVRFIANGDDMKAWFQTDGIVIQRGGASVREQFVGASRGAAIEAFDDTGASVNFLRGDDPTRWRTGLPLYGGIRYHEVWPGIDIVYRGESGHLKAEYLVGAGADLSRIRLRFDGAAQILDDESLLVRNRSGEISETAPVLYQTNSTGERSTVAGNFKLLDDHTVGFDAAWDHSKPLVIDPPILFSGYFGGSSPQQQITAVAISWTNQIVVAGWTSSTNLPASNGARTASGGGVDAFVAAFSPAGGQLIWCTYLGGSGDDRAFGIALDSQLNTYVAGQTSSADFPLAGGAQRSLRGTRDAFVSKLNPSGTALVYSTYLGGSGVDSASAITLDSANNAIIAGDTTSSDLPVSSTAFQKHLAGITNAFVARVNAGGNAILSCSYLGGSAAEHAAAVAVDSAGHIYIGGATTSTNLPVASAYQAQSGGGQDGFIVAFASDASSLLFSTYLGGSAGDTAGSPEEVNGLAIDPTGNVIVAGTTPSSDFPITAGAYQTIFGGQTDGFVTKLSSTGQVLYSTFLGGSLTDGINALALDFHGYPYVTGYTGSTDFPVQAPVQNANAGLQDAFEAKLNSTLSGLLFGTYIGGSQNDAANAIAVDAQTGVVIAGETGSADFPLSGSLTGTIPGPVSAFMAKIAPGFNLGFVVSPYFYRDPWHVRQNSVSSFGPAGGAPVVGDWDGSGVKRIGAFRNGVWYLDINNDGVYGSGDKTVNFGQAGDVPVVGDWDGTGRIKLGLFRAGTFILDLSGHLSGVPTGNGDASFALGRAGDLPVAADWNGSGTTRVGVFRAGTWLVDYNGDRILDSNDPSWIYGQTGDLPAVGDWDGSGAAKIGVYRNGLWILDYDGDHAMTSWTTNELVMGYGGPSVLFKPFAW
jgi:hypothetical protein